jgi:hypothetical protein
MFETMLTIKLEVSNLQFIYFSKLGLLNMILKSFKLLS